ncbi:anaerobic sulfatase maturase [candidate division KSB1 bacterium]|nr:anaerobic sulfatase maturase [candidate division KSB1 bacterium]
MSKLAREFQIFAKPAGASCNLACQYCYYLEKTELYPDQKPFLMADDVLEQYIMQHIAASTEENILFSWHGGEPTILGLNFFCKIVELQQKYKPADRRIINGIQTNGTLIHAEWAQFFAHEKFIVGISLDGPAEMHNRYRVTKDFQPTHDKVLHGYHLLQQHGVNCEILCVVNAHNVQFPTQIYRYFKALNAKYLTFLPLVIHQPHQKNRVSENTVPALAFGDFLCTIFDEWKSQDIGHIKIQVIEEAARTAFQQDHTLCIFKKTCGGVPVVEHNGDFYSCDHFVEPAHYVGNIRETPLVNLLESPQQRKFGQAKLDSLPDYCRNCEVKEMCNGECPKNRFIQTPDGAEGLNYLCAGYKRFFTHCKPFVDQVALQWRRQMQAQQGVYPITTGNYPSSKTGRNDPCPCGSGRKYKNCCLGK